MRLSLKIKITVERSAPWEFDDVLQCVMLRHRHSQHHQWTPVVTIWLPAADKWLRHVVIVTIQQLPGKQSASYPLPTRLSKYNINLLELFLVELFNRWLERVSLLLGSVQVSHALQEARSGSCLIVQAYWTCRIYWSKNFSPTSSRSHGWTASVSMVIKSMDIVGRWLGSFCQLRNRVSKYINEVGSWMMTNHCNLI